MVERYQLDNKGRFTSLDCLLEIERAKLWVVGHLAAG